MLSAVPTREQRGECSLPEQDHIGDSHAIAGEPPRNAQSRSRSTKRRIDGDQRSDTRDGDQLVWEGKRGRCLWEPALKNDEFFLDQPGRTGSPPTPDAGGESVVVTAGVEGSHSNATRFRGVNDGSWPVAEARQIIALACRPRYLVRCSIPASLILPTD